MNLLFTLKKNYLAPLNMVLRSIFHLNTGQPDELDPLIEDNN